MFVRLVGVFAEKPLAGSTLVVDQTAVGRPVLEMLRRSGVRAVMRALSVTAGHGSHADERGAWLVPRTELAGTLQVLLQSGRLKVADALPEADTLARELAEFRSAVPERPDDDSAAWREGANDDLVLAVAAAAWEGERRGPTGGGVPYVIRVGGQTRGW